MLEETLRKHRNAVVESQGVGVTDALPRIMSESSMASSLVGLIQCDHKRYLKFRGKARKEDQAPLAFRVAGCGVPRDSDCNLKSD